QPAIDDDALPDVVRQFLDAKATHKERGLYRGAPASRRLAGRRPAAPEVQSASPPPTQSALRTSNMRHDNFIHPARGLRIRSRGTLPHWEIEDSTYFVTFRLRDSLPREVAVMLAREKERATQQATTAAQRAEINRLFGEQLDRYLDAGHGSAILSEHGALVADALKHFDGARYELLAWCVMPNHVHVLLFVPGRAELDKIVHSWKSYTAHAIGRGV